ncbi:hypothetical protein GCM10029964_014660 [Kibdelosporangium lantanae]
MTDTRVNTATTPPTPAPTVPDPGATSPAGDPAPATTPPAEEADYKALYEQTTAKLRTAEQTARTHRDKARKLDELEAAQQTETEKAAARAEAAEQQVAELRRRAVDAEIRASATGWADPADAPLYVADRDKFVREDGAIDTAAITAELAAVLATRPHLARVDGPRRPAPDPSQGAHSGTPQGLTEQIAEAERTGDWITAISLKNQLLAQQARKQQR